MLWTVKYAPKSCKEVVGQDAAMARLKDFAVNYRNQRRKAMLLYGPPGVGKTCMVYALASELNLEVVELNASDFRKKDQIESILGAATQQMSLFSKGKIILVDEIDGISGQQDRGGIPSLVKLTAKSSFPIVMTANNPYEQKFRPLMKIAEAVEMKALPHTVIMEKLSSAAASEKLSADKDALKSLSRRAGGDLRGALLDLQSLSHKPITMEDVSSLSERNREEAVIQALLRIFKTTDLNLALTAFDDVDEDHDSRILWLEENIPKEYLKALDLSEAFRALSLADVNRGRIRRWQYWRLLVYINAYLTGGIAMAKQEKYSGFTKYSPTTRLLRIWQANMKYAKRDSIAEKMASKLHESKRGIVQHYIPYLKLLAKDKEFSNSLSDEFGLEKDEIDWLRKIII